MNVYDFTVKDRIGNDVSLTDYEGKVLLIVNTATGSGVSASFFVTSGSLKYKEILRQPSSVCYY